MSGLAKICKLYGELQVSSNGETVAWVWDYALDKAVKKSDMPFGSERHIASEKIKWKKLEDHLDKCNKV